MCKIASLIYVKTSAFFARFADLLACFATTGQFGEGNIIQQQQQHTVTLTMTVRCHVSGGTIKSVSVKQVPFRDLLH